MYRQPFGSLGAVGNKVSSIHVKACLELLACCESQTPSLHRAFLHHLVGDEVQIQLALSAPPSHALRHRWSEPFVQVVRLLPDLLRGVRPSQGRHRLCRTAKFSSENAFDWLLAATIFSHTREKLATCSLSNAGALVARNFTILRGQVITNTASDSRRNVLPAVGRLLPVARCRPSTSYPHPSSAQIKLVNVLRVTRNDNNLLQCAHLLTYSNREDRGWHARCWRRLTLRVLEPVLERPVQVRFDSPWLDRLPARLQRARLALGRPLDGDVHPEDGQLVQAAPLLPLLLAGGGLLVGVAVDDAQRLACAHGREPLSHGSTRAPSEALARSTS